MCVPECTYTREPIQRNVIFKKSRRLEKELPRGPVFRRIGPATDGPNGSLKNTPEGIFEHRHPLWLPLALCCVHAVPRARYTQMVPKDRQKEENGSQDTATQERSQWLFNDSQQTRSMLTAHLE